MDASPGSTRDRLIAAMVRALRTRGFHGVGLNELLAEARAPKGVLYHHFPGGKAQLAIEAIEAVVEQATAGLERTLKEHGDAVEGLRAWIAAAERSLTRSGFQQGCPLATIALESSADDATLRAALASGFARLRETLARALVEAGMESKKARGLSALIVSAYEGALIQARVAGSPAAMRDSADALLDLVRASLPERRP
jgi:TetR/AcrR family transcriptional repressor of lmrAB and yxaGH operons